MSVAINAKKAPLQRSQLILTTRIGEGRAVVSALPRIQAIPSGSHVSMRLAWASVMP